MFVFNYRCNEKTYKEKKYRVSAPVGANAMTIGQRLREIRREKGLTLKQLADSSGLTLTYLSDVERDQTRPSLKALLRIASALEVSMADLLSGVEEFGTATDEALPAGLRELKDDPTMADQLDDDWLQTLQRLNYRGKRPQTKEEWREIFMYLRRILNG